MNFLNTEATDTGLALTAPDGAQVGHIKYLRRNNGQEDGDGS